MARGTGAHLEGVKALRAALEDIEKYADDNPAAKTDIARVREKVLAYAPAGPTPRRSNTKPLRSSFKTSVTRTKVALYSTEPHSDVQDRGGRVGRNRATVLPRALVSKYASRAIRDTMPERMHRVDDVLDEVVKRFGK